MLATQLWFQLQSPSFYTLSCEAGNGTLQIASPSFLGQLDSHLFLAAGGTGRGLKWRRKEENGLRGVQLLSALLLGSAVALAYASLGAFQHQHCSSPQPRPN